MKFPIRISRADAIAIANRGGYYAVHAARERKGDKRYPYQTACGRMMNAMVNQHPGDHGVSCVSCARVTKVERLEDRVAKLEAVAKPFVDFIDKFDARPLGNTDDEFYSIHAGEDGASLRLSDMRKLRSIVRS